MRGSVMRPDLGFIPLTLTPSVAASFGVDLDRGILVAHVVPGAIGADAGLQMGDIITHLDGHQIYNVGDFWHLYLSGTDQASAQLTLQGKTGQSTVSLPRTQSVTSSLTP